MSSTAPNDARILPKDKCDMCGKKNGFRGLFLQKCTTCEVCVHGECYGVGITRKSDPNFKCWACAAVGTTISCRVNENEVAEIIQKERPVACCLCSAAEGIHAMHAVYDNHGRKGKQLSLPADEAEGLPLRPAWAHSICCFFLTHNVGSSVYGCDRKGRFEGEDEEAESESESESESVSSQESNPSVQYEALHHFVISGLQNGEHTKYSWNIHQHRTDLVCSLCGQKDTKKGILRIPIQCSAGDVNEFDEFRQRHVDRSPCFVALHVGCAKYGVNGEKPRHKRVYFYPGHAMEDEEEGFNESVVQIYCDAHAAEISINKESKADKLTSTPHNLPPKISARPATNLVAKSQEKYVAAHVRRNLAFERRRIQQPGKKKCNRDIHLTSNTISNSKQSIEKRALREGVEAIPVQKRLSTELPRLLGNASPRRRSSQDTVETEVQRASPGKKKDWYPSIYEDVLNKVQSAKSKGANDLITVTRSCRIHWKEITGLEKAAFKEIWEKVKENVQDSLTSEEADSAGHAIGMTGACESISTKAKVNNTERADDLKISQPLSVLQTQAAKGVAHSSDADRLTFEEMRGINNATDSSTENGMLLDKMRKIKSPWQFCWVGDPNYREYDIGDWDSSTYKLT